MSSNNVTPSVYGKSDWMIGRVQRQISHHDNFTTCNQ